MGLLANILEKSGFVIEQLDLEQRGPSFIGPTSELLSASRYAYYDENLARRMEQIDKVHPYVSACIHAIARNISSVPLKAYRNLVHEPQAPLQKLLEMPNMDMGGGEYVYGFAVDLLAAGNCFSEIVLKGGQPVELYIIQPPSGIKVVARENPKPGQSIVDHYLYQPMVQMGYAAGTGLWLDYEQIIHGKMFDAIHSFMGMSPIQAALEDVATDLQARTWAEMFFRNDATPRGVIQTDQLLSKPAIDDFERRWEEMHRGFRNAFRIAILQKGMKYQQISVPPGDIQLIEGRRLTQEQIRAVYGVPAILLGDQSVGLTGSETAMMSFFVNVVMPLGHRIEDTLNRSLVARFYGREWSVRFDFARSEAMLPVVKEKMLIHQMMVNNGWPIGMIWPFLWGMAPPYADKSIADKAYIAATLYELGSANRSVSGEPAKTEKTPSKSKEN